MFDIVLPRFGITTSYVDGWEVENFEKAIQKNTAIIYLETPNGWSFYLQDIEAVAKLTKSKNILTICDNSYCTPLYQRPIESGIDLVLQSATKYLNGHSDVVAGVLCCKKEMIIFISLTGEILNRNTGII